MFTSYRGGGLGNHQGGGVGHISGMGQVSLYGHEQLIVSTVDHDVSQEEVVGQLSSGHHSVKIEEEEVRMQRVVEYPIVQYRHRLYVSYF